MNQAQPPEASYHGPSEDDQNDLARAKQHLDRMAMFNALESEGDEAFKRLKPKRSVDHLLPDSPELTAYIQSICKNRIAGTPSKLDIMYINMWTTLSSGANLEDTVWRMVPIILECTRQNGFVKHIGAIER